MVLIRDIRGGIVFKFTKLLYSKSTMSDEKIKYFIKCKQILSKDNHKGEAGRIGIVGGSAEYTGAPYFAAISALKVGADLVHVFSTPTASTVIKSYSPDLIVHPLMIEKEASNITSWLDRLHVVVVGPGLGRETETMRIVTHLIRIVKEKKIPLIIDADGLFLITENPNLISDFKSLVILTPNSVEFERLYKKLNGQMFQYFGDNVLVLRKGCYDEILSANKQIEWRSCSGGSNRRCGGQGDILSGTIATFVHWTLTSKERVESLDTQSAGSLACYAASRLVRLCNEKAFSSKGRSMLASDMIDYIHESFEELFGK